jgi:2-oxoglutarate ferredoxin oxidoreductase subunit beta
MDNEIYGLTKGQPSPTSPMGMEKKASPYGTVDSPIDPIQMALAYNASFVARGFSSKPKEVTELIKAAMTHKGFSFVQVLSPCVTFYDTYDHFKQITAPMPAGHDPSDRGKAMQLAMTEEQMYLGIFYQQRRPTYDESVRAIREKNAKPDYGVAQIMNRYLR